MPSVKRCRPRSVRLNEELERRVVERTSQLETTNKDLQKQILERQMAEDALKDSERRLADIINFLPDATFVINREGVVIAWNRAIEKMTGIKAASILGKGNYEYATSVLQSEKADTNRPRPETRYRFGKGIRAHQMARRRHIGWRFFHTPK